ncbi:MAG: TolC family protein [Acidobacteria bacterium]|nr:TolC family protein [Acidobacteriota bacterium]
MKCRCASLTVMAVVLSSLPMVADEMRVMTLKEALTLALQQNPEILLARLDERRAQQGVQVARDPFVPKVVAGSGLAYSNGFPMSIEGSAPSLFQARAISSIFNKAQSYQIAEARQNARTASIDVSVRREEIAFRTASLLFDAQRSRRTAAAARGQLEAFEKVAQATRARVGEGRELPIEARRAELNVARARQRAEVWETQQWQSEVSLAVVLGLGAETRVRPAEQELPVLPLPASAAEALKDALDSNKEIRRMESDMLARSLEVRSQRSARWPKVDLVAQYAVFARFNNYEDYFRTFQRNNGQLGVSVELPLLVGSAPAAQAARAEMEVARLRIQIQEARTRISQDVNRSFQDLRTAQTAADVARLDLDVARDQTAVLLAQLEEGRTSLRQVEESRLTESEKWIAYYESRSNLDKARLSLLRQTGNLIASLH